MEESRQVPSCFGILDEVFPKGDSGIREVRQRCIECPFRVECLKKAISSEEGIKMREEIIRQMPVSGVTDWIKRWSNKKMLYSELEQESLWKTIWNQFKDIVLSPKCFFSKIKELTVKDALIFGIITGSIGSMFSLFWKIILLKDSFSSWLSRFVSLDSINACILISFFITPLLVFLSVLIYSFFIHIFLYIFGAGKKGFMATLYVVCYSQAVEVFSFVPMLGGIIASIWRIYLQIIGLKHLHDTSYKRIIISFLAPFVIFTAFLIVFIKLLYNYLSGIIS